MFTARAKIARAFLLLGLEQQLQYLDLGVKLVPCLLELVGVDEDE